MLEIRRWINILKHLKLSEQSQIDLYKKNMQLFEGVLYRTQRIKEEFEEKKNLSEFEIEAYSRSICSLSVKLMESWEEIVLTAFETLNSQLEQILEKTQPNMKAVKTILKCCKAVHTECTENGKLKKIYEKSKFVKSLWKTNILEELTFQKFFKRD